VKKRKPKPKKMTGYELIEWAIRVGCPRLGVLPNDAGIVHVIRGCGVIGFKLWREQGGGK